jgi:hypothetical protein
VGKRAAQSQYLFVGFVNTHPTANFEKFWIEPYAASYFGIDEIEWGSSTTPIPEPSSLLLVLTGLPGMWAFRGRIKKLFR